MSVWAIASGRNKAIDIGEWSICGGGLVESWRFFLAMKRGCHIRNYLGKFCDKTC